MSLPPMPGRASECSGRSCGTALPERVDGQKRKAGVRVGWCSRRPPIPTGAVSAASSGGARLRRCSIPAQARRRERGRSAEAQAAWPITNPEVSSPPDSLPARTKNRPGRPERLGDSQLRASSNVRIGDLMKLWRLTRNEHLALDGNGALQFGGRYSSPGRPIVSFASEAGLAVLVALRYWQGGGELNEAGYVLGWTSTDAVPERVPSELADTAKRAFVDEWAAAGRSLLIAVQSAVLPEADVILMNAQHPEARTIAPLSTRPFSFAECLHRPPMLEQYRSTLA